MSKEPEYPGHLQCSNCNNPSLMSLMSMEALLIPSATGQHYQRIEIEDYNSNEIESQGKTLLRHAVCFGDCDSDTLSIQATSIRSCIDQQQPNDSVKIFGLKAVFFDVDPQTTWQYCIGIWC